MYDHASAEEERNSGRPANKVRENLRELDEPLRCSGEVLTFAREEAGTAGADVPLE